MITFQPGKSYATRSICDARCSVRVDVAERTAKTITTAAGKVLRVKECQGVETVMPWGNYSMAPMVGADRQVAA